MEAVAVEELPPEEELVLPPLLEELLEPPELPEEVLLPLPLEEEVLPPLEEEVLPLEEPLVVVLASTVNEALLKPQCVPLPRASWPVDASLGTVRFTCELLTLAIPASCALPIQAAVIADSPVPVTAMTEPGAPLAGEKDAIVGCAAEAAAETVNEALLKPQFVPLPRASWPVTASVGTVMFTCVLLTLVIPASCALPIQAAVIADSPMPVTVMTVPGAPLAGEKDVIAGCGAAAETVNEALLKPQFVPLPRASWPVTASLGTVIFTCVLLTLVIPASCALPIQAAVIADNPVPVTVTTVPGAPLAGEKDAISGCAVLAARTLPAGAAARSAAPARHRR
ncbi:MAG TPA: hypothetical protein VMB48_01320 [Steroidobacteraceae bacterium]|nr:hypothetical protein [Steroidobacteraceae bacterium]